MEEYKCGYISILGRPNAGKSTLVNCLVGEKVAITSPKPQTTRNNILGIVTKEFYQLILVDTPGIHKSKNALDKYMMKNVRSAMSGANVNLYLIDVTKKLSEQEIDYIKNIKTKNDVPLIVVASKIDLIRYEEVLPILAKLGEVSEIDEIVPVSSLKNKNTEELVNCVLKYLEPSPVKNFEYDEDYYTNKSLSFIASETIREKTLYFLQEEIPHGI
ncbi:MAG: GTPase Era, partial [Clostridia bacterium]|nr:GTPase Era [Clostridia bacterium]